MFDLINVRFKSSIAIAVGASTSICAIVGLYLAKVFIAYKKGEDIQQAKRTAISIIVSLILISLFPGVDFWGHFGSLFSGLFLGLIILSVSDKEIRSLLVLGIVLLSVYSLILFSTFWF